MALLLENLGLFQEKPSLLSAPVYEVRTRVPPDIFAAFVSIIEGGRITLSEETCDSLRLLALEFRFKALSKACSAFMGLTEPLSEMDEPSSDEDSDQSQAEPAPGHGVTIVLEHHFRRYEVLSSNDDARRFVRDLERAQPIHIAIDGMKGHHRIVEKAVAAVYSNTRATLPNDDVHKGLLLLILWALRAALSGWNFESAIYCLHRANDISPSTFDQVRLMLLSQCDPAYADEFVPLPNVDWVTMFSIVSTLRDEKNGKAKDARRLLRKLKDSGQYSEYLAHC
jgi:hypothetical protein